MERAYRYPTESRFNAFDNMLEGISVYKLIFNDKNEVIDGILEYMNTATVETMDINPEESIGKNATELFDSDFIRPFIESVNEFFTTRKLRRLEVFYPPTNKYFLVSGFEIPDNLFAVLRVDITEQKQAQNDLRQSEEKYHSLFKNNHAVMLIIDPYNGDIVDANPAASLFYGYTKEEFSKLKITDINALSEEDVFKEMQKAELMKRNHFLFKHRLSTGEIKDVEVYSGPITVEDRKLIYSIIHDITEQKRAEEHEKELLENTRQFAEELKASNQELRSTTEELQVANEELKLTEETLRQSQKLLQSIIDSYPSIIFVKDIEGRFITINRKLEQLIGIKKEELEGKTDYDIFPEEEAEYYREHDQKVLTEGIPVQFEEVADLVDGRHIFLANKFPLYDIDGNPYGVGSISIDITERKQLEEELRQAHDYLEEQVEERTAKLEEAYQTLKENEIKYRSLYENAPVGIFHSTVEGKYIDVNPELAMILGYDSPHDLISTVNKASIADIIYVNKDLRPLFLESTFKTDDWFKTENLYRRKDGETIIGELSFRNIGTPDNPLLEGFMIDITARKKAENELKETIAELERSNEELQSFAYITSHDLQEPLRTIASYAGLIEKRYRGRLDSDADEFLDYMISASKRMKEMIQGLLDYSRIGTRGSEFVKTDMNINLENAVSNLKSSIDESNAKITHETLPNIIADPNQMARVFQNLISNAIKFKKPDESPEIHISAERDIEKQEWVFSVSDNSIGMEEQYTHKIFEVFKRLHTIDEYEGTGIGLAVVKRIIDRHGGRVWVESELDVGSVFYFTIPSKGQDQKSENE